jgi:hypothetical protein
MMIKTDDNNHRSANDCHQKVSYDIKKKKKKNKEKEKKRKERLSYDNSEKDMIWVGNPKIKQGWR